jgi:hypothetical protein
VPGVAAAALTGAGVPGVTIGQAVPTAGLVLGTAAAAVVATVTPAGGTAAAVLLCWALDDGFAVHRFGELHLAAADRHALLVVAGTAAVAFGIAALVRADPVAGARRVARRRHGWGHDLRPELPHGMPDGLRYGHLARPAPAPRRLLTVGGRDRVAR